MEVACNHEPDSYRARAVGSIKDANGYAQQNQKPMTDNPGWN